MGFYKGNKLKFYSVIALAVLLALLVPMVSMAGALEAFADTNDYYELKVGEDTVAVLANEDDAYELIEKVKDNYLDGEENVVDVKLTPAVTVEKVSVPKEEEQPQVESDMGTVLDTLLDADENDNIYVVKDGDTLWDISMALGMSLDAIQKQNPEMDPNMIAPGDEISVKNSDSLINVIVEYEVQSEIIVPFETIYEEDPEMDADDEEIVKTEGVKGKKVVTEKVVKVNGIIEKTEEISTEMVTEPVARVVVRGVLESEDSDEESEDLDEGDSEDADTEDYDDESEDNDESSYSDDSEEVAEYDEDEESYDESSESSSESYEEPSSQATYSGSGYSVVDYALQFVGYPYVWGGTSLTNGCDCSGFIWRVFNDCGYSISRWPDDDFPHVSASELRPGDITRYGGHYAIYIGNGMEISAVNEEQGIRTHPMYYSNSSFWYGIRVIG